MGGDVGFTGITVPLFVSIINVQSLTYTISLFSLPYHAYTAMMALDALSCCDGAERHFVAWTCRPLVAVLSATSWYGRTTLLGWCRASLCGMDVPPIGGGAERQK